MKSHYTKKEYDNTFRVQETYQKLGYLSIQDFKDLIKSDMIKNCPVSIKNIEIAELIFGPDIYSLKGKSTRPLRGRTEMTFCITDYIKFPQEV